MTVWKPTVSSLTGLCLVGLLNQLSAVPQTTAASSDAVFGMALRAQVPDPNPPPTLRMPLEPPTYGYQLVNAFGNLTFPDPVALATPPGETNRLFVVEQAGRIAVITNLAAPTRTVFLDIAGRTIFGGEQGLLGLAFHPGYATNRQFYIFYTANATTAQGTNTRHDRLSRMLAADTNPNQADPGSETVLLEQYDQAGNHNGGDVHFGPDGYLYVSEGDEGGGNDQYNNSPYINRDFFAGLLRLDVDGRPGSLMPNPHPANTNHPSGVIQYRIPPDNPWVGATSFNGSPVNPATVRTEFYAVGLRNGWRFSFDPATGDLYLADVGQNLYEEVNLIRRGGNYGWSYREGLHPGPRGNPPAGVVFDDPIAEYTHGSGTNQGFSVTGGVVYRGSRFPALAGVYVFADYVSGNVWALRANGTNVVPFWRLTGDTGIAGFGVDPRNGDVLTADLNDDTIRRLIENTNVIIGPSLPPTLAHTGAFTNLALLTSQTEPLTPNVGVLPYEINVPFWSDNAHKTRWFFLPTNGATLGFSPEGNWTFPDGMAWVKHFDLEMTNGMPASARRLETRILVKVTNGVYGATYRWGNSLTNATLVPDGGARDTFVIRDGDTPRFQVWHYPSRAECLVCHTRAGGWGLGFHTVQLNRDGVVGGATVSNQIAAFSAAGFFDAPVANVNALRALAPAEDETASVEWRVRSYLAANCAHCHQPGAPAPGFFNASVAHATADSGLINGPLNDVGGDSDNRVVVPGSLAHSMLLTRIATRGPGQMPPLASSVLDRSAIALLSRWITNDLAGYRTFAEWQQDHFGSTTDPDALAEADPDEDGASNHDEFVNGTHPWQAGDVWGITAQRNGSAVEISFPRLPNRAVQIEFSPVPDSLGPWQLLDVPENQPVYPATDGTAIVPDPAPSSPAKFYRARVQVP